MSNLKTYKLTARQPNAILTQQYPCLAHCSFSPSRHLLQWEQLQNLQLRSLQSHLHLQIPHHVQHPAYKQQIGKIIGWPWQLRLEFEGTVPDVCLDLQNDLLVAQN